MNAETLKPCPFCGGEADFQYHNGGWPDACYSVRCKDWKCPGKTSSGSQAVAADAWNTRAADNIALQAEVERLKSLHDAVMKHIPMDYLQRHDAPGATGPTSSLVLDAAMRDYAEDRWKLIERIKQEKAENAKLRAALSGVLWMADEWFEHGGDETTCADEYAEALKLARAALHETPEPAAALPG